MFRSNEAKENLKTSWIKNETIGMKLRVLSVTMNIEPMFMSIRMESQNEDTKGQLIQQRFYPKRGTNELTYYMKSFIFMFDGLHETVDGKRKVVDGFNEQDIVGRDFIADIVRSDFNPNYLQISNWRPYSIYENLPTFEQAKTMPDNFLDEMF